MARKIVNKRTGNVITLLTPAEKGKKYAIELRHKKKITNAGQRKRAKNGKQITLSKQAQAYRSGYLQARKDNAKCYKAIRRKKRMQRKR